MAESMIEGGVRQTIAHDSAHKHVSGEAIYTDDIPLVEGQLNAAVGMSEKAHARIVELDLSAVYESPGVRAVVSPGVLRHLPGLERNGRQSVPVRIATGLWTKYRNSPGQNRRLSLSAGRQSTRCTGRHNYR